MCPVCCVTYVPGMDRPQFSPRLPPHLPPPLFLPYTVQETPPPSTLPAGGLIRIAGSARAGGGLPSCRRPPGSRMTELTLQDRNGPEPPSLTRLWYFAFATSFGGMLVALFAAGVGQFLS